MAAALEELPVEQRLLAKRENGVGHIIFNNPAKRNAVSLDMWERLTALLKEYADDPDLKVLVISGAGGKAFVSGADISKFESQRSTQGSRRALQRHGRQGIRGGLQFPQAHDREDPGLLHRRRLQSWPSAAISASPPRTPGSAFRRPGWGWATDMSAVRRLAEIIGISNAMEIFFTARQFTAAEALSMGLVNQVVPAGKLDATVDEMTRQIAENAPLTIAAIKASARELGKPEAARDLARLDRHGGCLLSRPRTISRAAAPSWRSANPCSKVGSSHTPALPQSRRRSAALRPPWQ